MHLRHPALTCLAVLLLAGCTSTSNLAGVTPTPSERTPTPNIAEANVPKTNNTPAPRPAPPSQPASSTSLQRSPAT